MGLRFRPVDGSFYGLFCDAAQHLTLGAQLLAEMLNEDSDREAIGLRMREAEHAADETTHAIGRRAIGKSVTPFGREDIYALASSLDDVMDMMDEVVDLILLYEVAHIPAELSGQVEVIQRCAEVTAHAMPRLESMTDLDEYWIEINRLENVGDKNHRRLLAQLFSGEFEAMEVLKLKDIVESLEGAIDAFEKVAHTVERIAAKQS